MFVLADALQNYLKVTKPSVNTSDDLTYILHLLWWGSGGYYPRFRSFHGPSSGLSSPTMVIRADQI